MIRWFRKCQLITVLCFIMIAAGGAYAGEQTPRTLLVISLDGYRYDYCDSIPTPNIRWLIEHGTSTPWMKPSFPTKTFPNHYTLVTGLHPGHHGIVGNKFYDTSFATLFHLRNREVITQSRWWGGEPIWITAEKNGKRAGTMFWPGSESELHGLRPSYWATYDQSLPYADRIRQLMHWTDLPKKVRPQLLTIYFEGIDEAGHRFGPFSREVVSAILHADSAIGQLVAELKKRKMLETTNILLVSDHGMSHISRNRTIMLDDIISLNSVLMYDWSPVTTVWVKNPGETDSLVAVLKKGHPHLTAYRKEEVPGAYQFSHPTRVGQIVLVADEGWEISNHAAVSGYQGNDEAGDHGYSNDAVSMRAFFAAAGPSFKAGRKVEPFQNINIYNLMCLLLDVRPAPNDGDMMIAKNIVRSGNK